MLLSLDIAGANTGYTVWDQGKILDCGVVKTEKGACKRALVSDDNFRRATELIAGLAAVIGDYRPGGVIGEMPSGSQSAVASKLFGIATGAVAAVCHQFSLPAEFCTQQAVKVAACGKKSASKEEIIDTVVKKMCIEFTEKHIPITRGRLAGSANVQRTYYACGKQFPEGAFEHIADSVAVYWALRNNNLIRLFG